MKRLFSLFFAGLSLVGYSALAEDSPWWGHLGYRYITGLDFKYTHDTHPDDRWLPNGNVPGSAGTTHVSDAHVIQLGVGRDFPLPNGFVAWSALDLGVGLNMENHQIDNDYRPAANAAFVFSWPAMLADVGLGVGYDLGRVRLGADARGGGLLILSGYDRYSSLDARSTDWEWMYGAGPKISLRLGESVRVEGRALFGNANSYTINLVLHF